MNATVRSHPAFRHQSGDTLAARSANPPGWASAKCHVIRDTFRIALAASALALATGGALAGEPTPAGPPAKPCCPVKETPRTPAPCCGIAPSTTASSGAARPACCAAEKPAADPHASHAEHTAALQLPPGDFTRESLYQAEATFTDDAGQPFVLGSLRGRPVVLTMFFSSCSYACPLLVADMTRIRDALPPAQRKRAVLVLLTFDTVRDTPETLRAYRESRGLDGQWVLLHASDDSVREIAALLGVKFKQEASGQFAHSNLISILNAQGEIVHQRAGLKGGLDEAGRALVAVVR